MTNGLACPGKESSPKPLLSLFSSSSPPPLLLFGFSWLVSSSSGNSILHSAADSVTSAVQKASQALNERGERLGRAEDKTAEMMNSAEQFAVTAHKVSQGCGVAVCRVQGLDLRVGSRETLFKFHENDFPSLPRGCFQFSAPALM